MVDFWAKKRQQLEQEGKLPTYQPQPITRGPWWEGDDRAHQTVQQTQQADPDTTHHDFSRADSLRSKVGNCPNCNGTNFVKPTSSSAARCWNCGYIEGRQVNDLDTFALGESTNTLSIRQTADGGAQKYRARMSHSASDLAQANMELEASLLGKAKIDQ